SIMLLAHPPKTTAQHKHIPDENMIRGSGDWLAQLDSFLVLRPVSREPHDAHTETITTRLIHAKARSGPPPPPLPVQMFVTADLPPPPRSRSPAPAPPGGAPPADIAAAVKAIATLFEEGKRLSRRQVMDTEALGDLGRPARDAGIAELLKLGVIRG